MLYYFLDFGNVWGVDYDESIDESNKIRSSTGIMASWMSPIGPMTFTFSKTCLKQTQMKQKALILILEQHFKIIL